MPLSYISDGPHSQRRNHATRRASIQASVRSLLTRSWRGSGAFDQAHFDPRKTPEHEGVGCSEFDDFPIGAPAGHFPSSPSASRRSSFSALSHSVYSQPEACDYRDEVDVESAVFRSNGHPLTACELPDEHERRSRERRHRRHRRHQKHRRQRRGAWQRKSKDRPVLFACIRNEAARKKSIVLFFSGLILAVALTTYLCLALTREYLEQEVHVLLIIVIICSSILFCHALIRLCMLALGRSSRGANYLITGGPSGDGFAPSRPIRVHLARDEELGLPEPSQETVHEPISCVEKAIIVPPPAYGVWRCSVRANPNLLHWRRVDPNTESSHNSTKGDQSETDKDCQVPRPPSYLSDDGVDYVVQAASQSTVGFQQEDQHGHDQGSRQTPEIPCALGLHPAYR